MSYSKEFKVFVATIYGEAANSSIRSWEIIAHSMRNRIGFGNWTEYSTIYAIATTTGYDAYTRKNNPYNEAMSQFKSEKISSSLKTLINTVRPIYEGKIKDDTSGVVFYWSPKAQKQLHRDNPKLYTTAIPDWVKDNKKEIVKIAGTEKDDFQWLRFQRSKMFVTLHDNKGLPMDGVSVDIRFASGKKVPVLSNLKTNSKGQLPVFFARIEMGARFIVDGTYLKDKKGSNLKILPTGKDIVVTIIVDTGNGFKSGLEKHETGSENTQVRNDTVGIDSTQKTNNTSNSERVDDLKEVTFNIKLVEGDTGKPLPNTTYHLEYKNNIKPHKTDSSGIESGITADVSHSISVYLDDDDGKKQSIYSMAFPVIGDLNGQTKILKVPVVTLQLIFVDKNKKPVPNYEFKTVYRGRISEIKKANARGIATVKALAGQKLKIIHVAVNKFTSNIVTDGSTKWTYNTDKLIGDPSNSPSSTSNVATSTPSSSQKPDNTKPIATDKGNIIRNDKITPKGPTHEIKTDKAKITIKFLDEDTNQPLSGLTYWTQSTKYGKNASTTGSDGTRGRTHDSDVGVSIAVLVNENGKEVKKGTIIATSDKNGTAYVYKAKKPKLDRSGAHWHSRFKASTSLDDLSEPFKSNAKKFISALKAANISVRISTTYRPDARSYLMYYSTNIKRGKISPEKVPPWPGVNIDWTHGGNESKAIEAARAMHASYGIGDNPVGKPSNSNHNVGLAVDMTITNYSGKTISLNGKNHKLNGFNDLVAAGKKVSVIWYGSNDKPHWSQTGR